jgi:hypothetical protein
MARSSNRRRRKQRHWCNRQWTILTKTDVRDSLVRLLLVAETATAGSRVRADHRKWLSPPDPSSNQNIACGVQHEGTATWFFEGSLFTAWRFESSTPLLWIHGKRAFLFSFTWSQRPIARIIAAGSGKSILWLVIIFRVHSVAYASN